MGKRLITSILGIPIIYWTALIIFFILQISFDLMIGDRSPLRYSLLISSIIGLILMIIFSMLKKKTIINILNRQIGI